MCLHVDLNMLDHLAMPACTRALTYPSVKFPWPWLLIGCAYYQYGVVIVVVNFRITAIDRYALTNNANYATMRSCFVNTMAPQLKYISHDSYDRLLL